MDWDKLRIFYSVAQAGSFTRAGDGLGLSQSAVSRQISGLEESLGVPLFHRHARGLILTEQGDILYQTVKDIFGRLAAAENAITESKDRPKGPLKITVSSSMGTIWLAPFMAEFVELYPEISVTLIMDDRELDLSMREADVAIRLFAPKQPDLIHRHLMKVHSSMYASADYLRKFGVPTRAEDLENHRLILFPEGVRAPFDDINWIANIGLKPGSSRKCALRANALLAILKAAEAGLGIAGLPDYLVRGSNLTRIMDGMNGPEIDAYFVYPSELRNSKRLKVFRDFILRKVSESSF